MPIDPDLLPKDDERDEDLARAWIAYRRMADEPSENWWPLVWASDRLDYLVEYLPHRAWQLVLLIWSMDQSMKVMQLLSAGPMEALLSKHGERLIDLVEIETRRDPSFARMLGGVWKFQMTDEVWERLQKVQDQRGWDDVS